MPDTYLSQAVETAAHAGAAYDTNAKYLLADKQVLAWILKYAVTEFADMEIPAIINCIGNQIEISTEPVDPGLSATGRAEMTATEDDVPGEGKIFYDIRFTAYLPEPEKEREIKFLVNLEAQKSTDPAKLGYHLENRIVFYLARMVSAQKQTEFLHSKYDSLKRVRSIWICMDSGEEGDSMQEIGLRRKTIYGKETGEEDPELMKAVMIRIRSGTGLKESGHILIRMLETLFAESAPEKKKQLLQENYGMVMTVEMERRIRVMCNLSEAIFEEALKKGMEKGMEKERLSAIGRMIRASASKEQILTFGYTQEEYAEAENILQEKAGRVKNRYES